MLGYAGPVGSSAATAASSFSGDWTDHYSFSTAPGQFSTFPGPWILVQTGSNVCVAYTGSGGGKGSGTVSGRTLTGSSKDSYGTSNFTVTLSSDGQSAIGTWSRDSLSGNLKWTRNGPAAASSCGRAETAPTTTIANLASKPKSKLTINEVEKIYQPHDATVRNGAKIRICNPQNFDVVPFSLSRYNTFNEKGSGSWDHGVPKGVQVLRSGQCMNLTAHNPIGSAIFFKIYDAIHGQTRMVITVMPST
jgi:hypothetical protein